MILLIEQRKLLIIFISNLQMLTHYLSQPHNCEPTFTWENANLTICIESYDNVMTTKDIRLLLKLNVKLSKRIYYLFL